MRKNCVIILTDAEKILWEHLKSKTIGLKFRRQHLLGNYIVDFYCHKIKLVIELDGSIHYLEEVKLNDDERQNNIELEGITVLRFKNSEIFNNISNVLKAIKQKM